MRHSFQPVVYNNDIYFVGFNPTQPTKGREFWKLTDTTLSFESNNLNDAILNYPNPTNSELNIKSDLLKSDFNIQIKNVVRANVLNKKILRKLM